MSQIFIDPTVFPSGNIDTLSAEGGMLTPPVAANFNFSGSIAGGSTTDGAILFSTPANGEMQADVQVDGTTIYINASNQLSVVGDYVGTATTSDGAGQTQTILTIPMTAGTSITIDGILAGYESTLPGGVGSSVIATFLRGSGGLDMGAQLIFQPDDQVNASASLSAATYSIMGSGNNIIIQVTGQPTYTINWRCEARTVTAP